MALRKKTLAIPLTGPLERRNGGEDLTANLTALPAIPRALNVYRSRTGEWKQRPGYVEEDLGGSSSASVVAYANVTGERHVLALGKHLVTSEGDPAARGYASVDYGSAHAPQFRTEILSSVSDATSDDSSCQAVACATAGGVIVYATTSYPSSTWTLTLSSRLAEDGANLSAYYGGYASQAFSGGQPRSRLLYSKVLDRFVFLFTTPGTPSTAATQLQAFALSPAQLLAGSPPIYSWPSGTVITSDIIGTATSVNGHFDAMIEGDTGHVLVAYRGTGGNTRALRFNPSTMVVGTGPVSVVAGGDVAANGLSWARVPSWTTGGAGAQTAYRLLTAINSAVGVVDRTISKATLTQSSSLTVKASPGNVGAVTGHIIPAGDGGTVGDLETVHFDVIGTVSARSALWMAFYSGGAWFPQEFSQNARIHGQPCFPSSPGNQIKLLPIVGSVDTSGKLLFTDAAPASYNNVFATALDGVADQAPGVLGQVSDVATVDGEVIYYGLPRWLSRSSDLTVATTAPNGYVKTANVVKMTAAHALPLRSVGLDSAMSFFPGSNWKMADRSWFSGAPWSQYQAGPPSGIAAGGAGSLSAGDYYYLTLPVCVDTTGRRWAGYPSVPVKFTALINSSTTMVITGLDSGFQGDAITEVYRNKANGTQWFRVGEVPGGASSSNVFTDALPDATLETSLPLYTDSGELLHVPPPPSHIAIIAGNRIVCVNSERPSEAWASSEFTPGEGPWFHPDVRLAVPGGEEIVALAFMDGRTYLFTRKSIFAVAGAWPGRTGAGQLPEVQRVASGFGGYSHETTLVTAEGIWFYSEDRGISLLDRGMAVRASGKIIDGVMTSAPVIAVQVEKFDHVRFYRSDGVVAVYDQVERQWSHWQIMLGVGETIIFAYIHNRDVYVCTNLRTLKEDAAVKADAGAAFDVGLDARIPLGPPGGKARIYRAILSGLVTADTKLYCTVFNDFGQVGSDEDAKVMTVKARPGETTPALYEQTIKPKRGRCDSMLLRFSYLSTEGGITFRALAVEVGGYQPATVARPGSSRQA